MDKTIELRAKCGRFRILVIGRANAGKTTILKKICDSIDEPIIYDREGVKVSRRLCGVFVLISLRYVIWVD